MVDLKRNMGLWGSNSELEKGVTIGTDPGSSSTNSGILKLESLEMTLKSVLFDMDNLTLLKILQGKLGFGKANSTAEEYNRITSYGNDYRYGTFVSEQAIGHDSTSEYNRIVSKIAFARALVEVSHVATLAKTATEQNSLLAQETMNKTMEMLKVIDTALSKGDSTLIPEELDGFGSLHKRSFSNYKNWHESETVLDLKGATLDRKNLENVCSGIYRNFGMPNLLVLGSKANSGFSNSFVDAQRIILNNGNKLVAGSPVEGIRLSNGVNLDISTNVFFDTQDGVDIKTTSSVASGSGPATPTTPTSAVKADSNTEIDQTNGLGTYKALVTAINGDGESAPLIVSSSDITVAANQSIEIGWTSSADATAYAIFLTEVNKTSGPYYKVLEVSQQEHTDGFDGGGAGKIHWRGRIIPNTTTALILSLDNKVMGMKELGKFSRFQLGSVQASVKFLLQWYIMTQLYAPKKIGQVINIAN